MNEFELLPSILYSDKIPGKKYVFIHTEQVLRYLSKPPVLLEYLITGPSVLVLGNQTWSHLPCNSFSIVDSGRNWLS